MNGLTRERIKSIARQYMAESQEHLNEAGETYCHHLWFTIKMSVRLVATGTVLAVHGLIPCLFTRTASQQVEAIFLIMKSRIPKDRQKELEADWQI